MDFGVVSKSEAEVGEVVEKDPTGRYVCVWDSQFVYEIHILFLLFVCQEN